MIINQVLVPAGKPFSTTCSSNLKADKALVPDVPHVPALTCVRARTRKITATKSLTRIPAHVGYGTRGTCGTGAFSGGTLAGTYAKTWYRRAFAHAHLIFLFCSKEKVVEGVR